MPSTLKRTHQRALTFSRSLANSIKAKFSSTFFDKRGTCSPFDTVLTPPVQHHISRPRHLRRGVPFPLFNHTHFIHRLPVEILAHVFVLGSEDDYMLPVSISHVCRGWREIALRTPSLWRRITLNLKTDMWRERIYRARACTLDVRLVSWLRTRSGNRRQFLDMYSVQWYMHIVTPLIWRWHSLEIVFTDYAPLLWNAALSGCCSRTGRAQAPALEDLTLIYRANDDTKEFCLFSGSAPRLRRLTLDGIRLTWLPALFSNLTYLDYTHHGFTNYYEAVNDILSMLEVSARLVELRILFPRKLSLSYHPQLLPIARPVLLPSLTHLHLRVEGGDIPFELAHLMALILTPCLTSLRFSDLDRRSHSFPSLKSFFFVYAISPSLRVLRIENGWYDPRMISPVLRSLPNLRQLILKRPHFPDQILDLNPRGKKWTKRSADTYHPMHFHVYHPDLKTRRGNG